MSPSNFKRGARHPPNRQNCCFGAYAKGRLERCVRIYFLGRETDSKFSGYLGITRGNSGRILCRKWQGGPDDENSVDEVDFTQGSRMSYTRS